MEINAIIEGERNVFAILDRLDSELYAAVREKIIELTGELEGRVRANAPHGKTGQLASSVHSSIRESEHRIVGIVTASAAYLPVIEFGIHRTIHVRGHERSLSHAWQRNFPPEQVFIDPYERMANVEGTFFMQRALESMESQIAEELRTTIDSVTQAVVE